jgi:hypothetical protein
MPAARYSEDIDFVQTTPDQPVHLYRNTIGFDGALEALVG